MATVLHAMQRALFGGRRLAATILSMTDSRSGSTRRGRRAPKPPQHGAGPDPEEMLFAAQEPAVALRAALVVARAEAMGLIPAGDEPHGFAPELFSDALTALARAGIGSRAVAVLREAQDPSTVLRALHALDDEIETSPVPQTEWRALDARLGTELLARLTGISTSSVRRYLAAERPTPDGVANRLHYLALLVADLAGGYNQYGIRRWFERPRSQLGQDSPAAILADDWDPDGAEPRRVRNLARALVASPAT